MKCRTCGEPKAPHRWTISACADNGKKRVLYLCDRHDFEMNAHMLAFFHIPGAYEKARRYAKTLANPHVLAEALWESVISSLTKTDRL